MTVDPRGPSIASDPRLQRNLPLLCAYHTLMMTLFPMAIITLYQKHELGLDMTEIMLLQAWFGLSLAVFEFPSGYVADRLGYRKSLIAASLLSMVGWTYYGQADGFVSVAIAEVILGLSLSLVSGTNSAMLYETLVELDEEATFGLWFARARFFGQFGEGSAALVAGILYAISLTLPFRLQAGIWLINLGVAFFLVEPAMHRPQVTSAVARVRALLRYVRDGSARLKATFSLTISLGLATFVPVWIIALYAEDAGVPVRWLGPLWAAANYVVALGSIVSTRSEQRFGANAVLVTCVVLVAIGYLGLGLNHAWWGFVFYFAFCLSRGLNTPILSHEEHRVIPSGDRASFVSLRSLVFRLAFCVLGPLVGLSIEQRGSHTTLLFCGLLFSASSLAAWFWFRSAPRPDGPAPALVE